MVEPFDFNLRHLDAIVAVARCGSISAGAVDAHLSQPALTQALSKIESQLGHPLFDRHARGVSATPAGALFLPRIRRALDQIATDGRAVRRSARLPPILFLERLVGMAQLRALSAVERFESYAMAARELGLSEPTVHRAVKDVELALGTPLFLRTGRTIRPTAAATRMVRAIRLAFVEIRSGLDELRALTEAGAGHVRIGALPLPRASLLPHALARFVTTHPRATISVAESAYVDLLSDLRNGTIDIIIGALRDPLPAGDVVQARLFVDPLWIVGRSGHPLADLGVPQADALARYPWVVSAPGIPMRGIWDALFAATEPPQTRIECSSILTARGLMVQGDWLALLSSDQFRIEQAAGLLVPIGPPLAGSARWIGFTIRKDWRPTATQSAFIEALEAAARERPYQD